MQWIEENIDAYRIVAEILNTLRTSLRRELEVIHGRDWHRAGVPKHVIDLLIERKEREKSIDWYETEYQELVDFTSFADLLDILEHNPDALPQVAKLAPSPALLHARFLELEVLRTKLGMARPISESELSFLGTFHLRFRQAIEDRGRDGTGPEVTPTDRHTQAVEIVEDTAPEPEPEPEPEPKPEPQKPVKLGSQPVKPPDEKPAEEPEPQETEAVEEPQPADDKPPRPSVAVRPPQRGAGSAAAAAQQQPSEEAEPETAPEEKEFKKPRRTLEHALEDNDHKTVLREMYKEVMSLAEGMWTSEVPPAATVWERVRVTAWYENNFSKLGLKPLSDFYGVISQVQTRSREGLSRDELQDFLKDSNFAQLLLSLRDMFQKNQI